MLKQFSLLACFCLAKASLAANFDIIIPEFPEDHAIQFDTYPQQDTDTFIKGSELLANTESLISQSLKPKVILIIDDLGDNYRLAKRIVDLPAKINLAFLPNTPFAKKLAQQGYQKGHDIMLHFPMEATTRPDLLGKGALTHQHSKEQAEQLFQANLEQIPHVVGFNNHMGSLMTQSTDHMRWVMDYAARRNLFFVDSRTIASSVAIDQALQQGVPSLGRDVFLDPVSDSITSEQQLMRALSIADKKGQVVVIGHPYRSTIELLERELPFIAQHYQLVTVSDYWQQKHQSVN